MDSTPNGTQPRKELTPKKWDGTQPRMDLTPKWDDSTRKWLKIIMLSCTGFFFHILHHHQGSTVLVYAFHYGFIHRLNIAFFWYTMYTSLTHYCTPYSRGWGKVSRLSPYSEFSSQSGVESQSGSAWYFYALNTYGAILLQNWKFFE